MAQDGETSGDIPGSAAPPHDEQTAPSSAPPKASPSLPHRPKTQIALADGVTTAPGSPTPAPHDGDGAGDAAPHESPGMRNSKGWDGKLRLPKKATVVLANPEALSDPEYSDDDNVVPGEVISADEDLLDDEDPDTDEIICTHSRVHSIALLHLERFPRCQRLCLRQNAIQSIVDGREDKDGEGSENDSWLEALTDLRELDLYDNLIGHMRGVERLPNLTSLDLSFNKIRHIRHLQPLRRLTDLYLVANKIGTVDGLAGVAPATLRMLELGSNRLRTVAPLATFGFEALEELWLAKNKITSLEGLRNMPRLRLLSVQANRIRDLAPLRDVPTLEELYVSNNMLESLASLAPSPSPPPETSSGEPSKDPSEKSGTPAPSLPNLRVLDAANNQLTSLAGVERLAALEEVWAGYNRLIDFADVEACLRDKASLNTVYLEGNPLQLRAPALYRNKVRLALPQVQQIDATYVRDT